MNVFEKYPDISKANSKVFQDIPNDELLKYIEITKDRGYVDVEIHKNTWRTANIWGNRK